MTSKTTEKSFETKRSLIVSINVSADDQENGPILKFIKKVNLDRIECSEILSQPSYENSLRTFSLMNRELSSDNEASAKFSWEKSIQN